MLQVPTGTGNASPEAPRLSASLSKLGTEALKKAAAPAPPRPLLQPSAADRKEPAMFENEETKVRGPLPPSRAKRCGSSTSSTGVTCGLPFVGAANAETRCSESINGSARSAPAPRRKWRRERVESFMS